MASFLHDPAALARASAGLAQCVAGIRLHGTGRAIRVASDGGQLSAPPPPASSTTPITLDEEEIGTVWLERPCPPGPLGALALLAEVPPDAARDDADVVAISRVAGSPEDLDTQDAYCTTGSLRQAADLLHLHHSSVARRLEQLGKTLGIDLTEPAGLTRARLALTTWRLLDD